MEDEIFDLLVKKDDITWKDILFDLVKTEQLDPWNINITKLASRYLDVVRKMKEFDFKVSGKIILAAALLLKIKSNKLVGEDIDEFDKLFSVEEIDENQFYEDLARMRAPEDIPDFEKISLIPRTPQPRERKVSIYDLVGALEKALEVKKRRLVKSMPDFEGIRIPARKKDITLTIKQLYKRILDFLLRRKRLTFSQLLNSDSKEDKVNMFVPLLHLTNDRKIDLEQDRPFEEIHITLIDKEKLKV